VDIYIYDTCVIIYTVYVITSVLCRLCLSLPIVDVSSAPREQISKAYIPWCSHMGKGGIRILGSAVATPIAGLLHGGVRGSPSTVCFVYFCTTDNFTVRMFVLSLLFLLVTSISEFELASYHGAKVFGLRSTRVCIRDRFDFIESQTHDTCYYSFFQVPELIYSSVN
jgi:hypothetical protein